MKETMQDTTREAFQKLLTETLFSGKHTKSTIARLKNLYDPKEGRTAEYDLVIYSQIDFSKTNKFFEKIEVIISNFKKLKKEINSKMYNEPVTIEFTSVAKVIESYYERLNYFINNMVDGLKKSSYKIECDSIRWGYPKGSLDKLKENVINLESKLAPLATSLSAELSDFNQKLTALGKDKPVDIIAGLINSMINHQSDQITGSSSSPLNRVDGYVQCGMSPLVTSKSLI